MLSNYPAIFYLHLPTANDFINDPLQYHLCLDKNPGVIFILYKMILKKINGSWSTYCSTA